MLAAKPMLVASPAAPIPGETGDYNPTRLIALCFALALLFFYFSSLHQFLPVNIYELYLLGLPSFLGLLMCGGVKRALQERSTQYWTLFVLLMVLVTPFSTWKGNSTGLVVSYIRTVYSVALLAPGLVVTWPDCLRLLRVVAASGATLIGAARLIHQVDEEGRLSLKSGSIANSNDLAAVLILMLPFLLWYALTGKWKAMRAAALAATGIGGFEILRTASRGALVGLAVAALFFFWRATMRQRIAFLALVPIAGALLVTLAPREALRRMTEFSEADETIGSGVMDEAMESSEMRKALLKKSIEYTFQRPLTGVGPGQFTTYEGENNILPGMTHGLWHNAHNSWTQVSSECGLPAFLAYLAAIIATFRSLNRTYKGARQRADCADIRTAAFCFLLALSGFCAAVTFVNFAYYFYLPVLSGMGVALARGAQAEMAAREARLLATHAGSAPTWMRA